MDREGSMLTSRFYLSDVMDNPVFKADLIHFGKNGIYQKNVLYQINWIIHSLSSSQLVL